MNFYVSFNYNATIVELMTFGIINAVTILFSIFIHELAHLYVARRHKLNTSEIILSFFGGSFEIEGKQAAPKIRLKVYAAGPLVNLLLGISLLLVLRFPQINFSSYVYMLFFFSGFTNIIIAVFNLIPTFPLDGGRILRAYILSESKDFCQATRIVFIVGNIFGFGFMLYGFYLIIIQKFVDAFWLILIGVFLSLSAWKCYRYEISTYMQELEKKFKQVEKTTT